MPMDALLADARRACLHRKNGLLQGSHLNAWLKIADRLLDACRIELEAAKKKKRPLAEEIQHKRDEAWERAERRLEEIAGRGR